MIIVSANHDLYDSRIHIPKPVKIVKYCGLVAGSKIMHGVELGDFTIVAVGAVVTKSFNERYCVLAGSPVVRKKDLNIDLCVRYEVENKFNGYIKSDAFDYFRKKNLTI